MTETTQGPVVVRYEDGSGDTLALWLNSYGDLIGGWQRDNVEGYCPTRGSTFPVRDYPQALVNIGKTEAEVRADLARAQAERDAKAFDGHSFTYIPREGEPTMAFRDFDGLREYAADARLGALVRRWRDHPERKANVFHISLTNADEMEDELTHLDRKAAVRAEAAARAAEEGEVGPDNVRRRVKDGRVEWREKINGSWAAYSDLVLSISTAIASLAARAQQAGGEG
jgi:hypothetical protein